MRVLVLVTLLSYGCGASISAAPSECAPCVATTRAPESGALEPATPEPGGPQPQHTAGALVEIEFQGTWYAGTVVQHLRDDLYEVAYDGYGDEWNRVARAGQLRVRAPDVAAEPPPPPGQEVTDVSQLRRGQHVFVSWGGTWYPATVRRIARGQAWVRYDGYEKEWDETVGPDRIRTLPSPNGANAPPAAFPPDPRGR